MTSMPENSVSLTDPTLFDLQYAIVPDKGQATRAWLKYRHPAEEAIVDIDG